MSTSDKLNENKAATQKIVEMFATGDLGQLNDVIAPGYLDHQGLGGVEIRGQHGFRQVVTAARTRLPNLRVVIDDLIAKGDKVVVRLQWRSVDRAGTTIDRETIDILRFVDGQAVEYWGAVAWASERRPRE